MFKTFFNPSISSKCNNILRFNNIIKKNYSSVWGERNMLWIEEKLKDHMEQHHNDYTFKVPFLLNEHEVETSLNRKRCGLVTPCVKLATSTWLINELLNRGYDVTGVAVPTASIEFIKSSFNLHNVKEWKEKDPNTGKDVNFLKSENPPLYIELKDIESFKPKNYETFDVVFDEQPLLEFHNQESNNQYLIKTTVLGHSLNVGGILYVQTEGAKNFSERQQLIEKIKNFYPDTHFVLIDSRRTPWTRQFLFLKAVSTIKK